MTVGDLSLLDKFPEYTQKRVVIEGNELGRTKVRFLSCGFTRIDTLFLYKLEGLGSEDGITTKAWLEEVANYVTLHCTDRDGEFLHYVYADKREHAKILNAMKRDSLFNFTAAIMPMEDGGFAIIIDQLELIDPN